METKTIFRYDTINSFNSLNPKIKNSILICRPYSFPTEEEGKNLENTVSSKLILCDHVCNSHDHSVLQSIDITRRNLMLITFTASRVKLKEGNHWEQFKGIKVHLRGVSGQK